MQESAARVVLPSGVWVDGTHQRVAWLRPLTGRDELAAAALEGRPYAARIDSLLAGCTTALGSVPDPPEHVIAALTLGDREALLLALRGLTYGTRIDALAHCPHCKGRLDLELTTEQLRLRPYAHPQLHHRVELGKYSVVFRLPTGADQLATAGLNDNEGEAELLRRCVVEVSRADNQSEASPGGTEPEVDRAGSAPATLPPELAHDVSAAMQRQDPQSELMLQLTCPDCARDFSTVLDTADYLLREIADRAGSLFAQVHTLALLYHWSEAEILNLPHVRRSRYLQLLDQPHTAGVPL
ncbi:hypothetical protein [Arthrobacter antioxidans]|uniref:T4 family baseplate hub assembly chaperone n=1 Tax=Arthrobacter antioxidans TaxID=2895818 RepID=UPI001FFE8CD2|nr:hypothetical protein [Arthrobacter antioxidans]